jgi:hypothetical protein
VFKATVKSVHGGGVALTAAVKTLKSAADGAARDELLREAALMALFQHPHVVALVGVVTVPRNMPTLLVLECATHPPVATADQGGCTAGSSIFSSPRGLFKWSLQVLTHHVVTCLVPADSASTARCSTTSPDPTPRSWTRAGS